MSGNKYQHLSEEDLVKLCKQDDCHAFDELIQRNKTKLYNYILSKTKNDSVAEEIMQISTIKAWKNIKKYEAKNKAKLLSWMTKIAFNAYYDYLRKGKREMSIEDLSRHDDSKHKNRRPPSDIMEVKLGLISEEPLKEIKIKELGSKIQKALNLLSEEHKQVLELKEIQDLSCEEISQKINCPYPTVCTRLFYARKNAKKILSKIIKNDR